MSGNFIKHLPQEAQVWAAKAVAGIIISDGVVTNSELEVLREAISFLSDRDLINQIVSQVKDRLPFKLEVFKCDRKLATRMLMSLAVVALVDDRLSHPEKEYFTFIGKKLGFEASYTHMVIKWGEEYLRLQKHKKQIMNAGEQAQALYSHL